MEYVCGRGLLRILTTIRIYNIEGVVERGNEVKVGPAAYILGARVMHILTMNPNHSKQNGYTDELSPTILTVTASIHLLNQVSADAR